MAGRQRIPRPPLVRPGAAAPWAGWRGPIGLDRVRGAVVPAEGAAPDLPLPFRGRPAAVLVAVFEDDGEARVVLTRRSSALRSHTGEVAFPGGRIDPGEDAVAAALREAGEEVGLDPGAVEVLGRLPPLATLSSRTGITPVVASLSGRPALRPNPAEVEEAFDVALSHLASEGVHREERWATPSGDDRAVHFFELAGDTVWGATARILHELLTLATVGPLGGQGGAVRGAAPADR